MPAALKLNIFLEASKINVHTPKNSYFTLLEKSMHELSTSNNCSTILLVQTAQSWRSTFMDYLIYFHSL